MTIFKSTIACVATVFAFILSLTTLSNVPAQAQSACKGLSKSACTSNSKCSHVAAFTRSDGARVKAFCRAKPGNGAKKTAKKSSSSKKKVATKRSSTTSKSTAKKTTTKKASTKKTATKKTTKKIAVAKKKPVKKTKKTTAKKPAKKKKKSTAGTS